MKILTKELLARFAQVGKQDGTDPIIIAKFFHPLSNWTWYATEFNPTDNLFFGLVDGFEEEWGYWSLDDMQKVVRALPCERDKFWKEIKISELPPRK